MLERAREFMADGTTETLIKIGAETVADMKELVSIPYIITPYKEKNWQAKTANIDIGEASKAGEPPRTRSGDLMRGIDMKIQYQEVEIGVYGVPYARALEYGLATRRLLPRPFFWPTVLEHVKNMPKIIIDTMHERVKL